MIIAGNQSYFFPYLPYFQLINAVDKFNLNDNFNFIAKGWVNRNNILLKDRGSFMISMPLANRSSFTRIRDLVIDDVNGTMKWRNKICKTIYDNYRHAPMFRTVYPFLETLIHCPTQYLSVLNINAITEICRYLEIETVIESDQDIYQHVENLLQDEEYISKNYPGLESREVRVLEICRHEGAEALVNSIGGMSLYRKEVFERFGISLKFLKSNNNTYRQSSGDFVPNLSIIDVLMFNEPEEVKNMLFDYELI
jgi:hypothetical protein